MGEARLTLRDIARALGVSTSTVSLALRDSPRISTPVRERVKAEAERIGYSTDLAGTLLRTSRPSIIGLLCRLDQDLHFTYREHILATAAARGYRTVVAGISRSTSAADALVSLRQLRCQALIVIDPGSLGSLGPQTGMPTVVIGQERPFASCDLVTSDNLAGPRSTSRAPREPPPGRDGSPCWRRPGGPRCRCGSYSAGRPSMPASPRRWPSSSAASSFAPTRPTQRAPRSRPTQRETAIHGGRRRSCATTTSARRARSWPWPVGACPCPTTSP